MELAYWMECLSFAGGRHSLYLALRNRYHSSLCSIYAIATRRSMPDIGSVEWATGDQGRERGSDGGWRNAYPSDGYCS